MQTLRRLVDEGDPPGRVGDDDALRQLRENGVALRNVARVVDLGG